MPGTRVPITVSAQAELALGLLRVLADRRRGWRATDLATGLDARPDLASELLGRLAAAGWVRAEASGGGTTYRYAAPEPEPTLHEVIDAIDGASVADDCVLRLGVCGGLSGRPVCAAHQGWLRQLTQNALIAVPLAFVPASRGPVSMPRLEPSGPPRGDRAAAPAPEAATPSAVPAAAASVPAAPLPAAPEPAARSVASLGPVDDANVASGDPEAAP